MLTRLNNKDDFSLSQQPMSKVNGTMCAISCNGVSKIFPVLDQGKIWRVLLGRKNTKLITALNDVSLSVPKGKFIGILGKNGAGKSTLLRTLAGVYTPNSGKISIRGSISGLFELGGLGSRYLTGREYARRILLLQGAPRNKLLDLLDDIYEFSELKSSFDRRIFTYSSGMAARLYFSAATALQYDIYLIDEILSVGDEHFQSKCWHRLRERFSHGASGILVTHDWSAVLRICEEAHILQDGKIVQSGRADAIVQSYLNLPLPTSQIAYFSDIPDQYTVNARSDAEISFSIALHENIPIEFSYSIEYLHIGYGWEIVTLSPWEKVAEKSGRYTVKIKIFKFPVNEGKYYLNLFLSSPRNNMETPVTYDVKSWTYGNGIPLVVKGSQDSNMLSIPLIWNEKKD